MLGCSPQEMIFEEGRVRRIDTDQSVSLAEISVKEQVANDIAAVATASHSSPVSPPPYMVGMVEIELDRYTGEVQDPQLYGSCGLWVAINPALARIPGRRGYCAGDRGIRCLRMLPMTETDGRLNLSFMQYKIPTRLDMGHLQVEFENSYEPTGPFGAKVNR